MAHYPDYRNVARALDDEGWRIRVLPTAYESVPFETAERSSSHAST